LPPLDVPLLSGSTETNTAVAALRMTTESGTVIPAPAAESSPVILSETKHLIGSRSIQLPSPRTALLGIWLLGTTTAVIAMLVSFARVRRLARSGVELVDEKWRDARARIASRLG